MNIINIIIDGSIPLINVKTQTAIFLKALRTPGVVGSSPALSI